MSIAAVCIAAVFYDWLVCRSRARVLLGVDAARMGVAGTDLAAVMEPMNTRREFFGILGAGAVASVATVRANAPAVCPANPTHVGVVTPESHRWRDARIWLDGEDVTRDCFYADDSPGGMSGRVKVYKRNAAGHCYIWGLKHDPDPVTRRDDYGPSKQYHMVDGKHVWRKPYPGFGDIAYDEFSGDVRIVVL